MNSLFYVNNISSFSSNTMLETIITECNKLTLEEGLIGYEDKPNEVFRKSQIAFFKDKNIPLNKLMYNIATQVNDEHFGFDINNTEHIQYSVYNENDKVSGKLIKQHKIEVPLEILHEGVDTSIYNNIPNDFKLDIEEDFAYLFVGHWLTGKIGHDRKDVGMLIKCFCESFNDVEDRPALILKTSSATFSVKQREHLRSKITDITKHYSNPPSIYLLFGQLTDGEMNGLYNHPKVKSMVTITKGEGYGRPLLEYTMTGKPVIASNWSGHKDFLPMDKAVMIGGKLVEVDESATNDFILKTSKWFTANYSEVVEVFKIVHRDYETFLEKSESLRTENLEKFSIESITEKFKTIMEPLLVEKPKQVKLNIPQLKKIEK